MSPKKMSPEKRRKIDERPRKSSPEGNLTHHDRRDIIYVVVADFTSCPNKAFRNETEPDTQHQHADVCYASLQARISA